MEQYIPQRTITEDEYLRLEEAAWEKHEFRNGQIVAMAGGTEPHADIAGSLIFLLRGRLKGKPCKAYGSDLRVRVNASGDYFYPDITVVCGKPVFARAHSPVAVTNPALVIEVTSASSEADDRAEKFSQYRAVDSLTEYVLVSSTRMQVESYYKLPDGVWAIGATLTHSSSVLHLRSLEIDLPLLEIYSEVELPAPPPKKAAMVE